MPHWNTLEYTTWYKILIDKLSDTDANMLLVKWVFTFGKAFRKAIQNRSAGITISYQSEMFLASSD